MFISFSGKQVKGKQTTTRKTNNQGQAVNTEGKNKHVCKVMTI